ncbi:MAG: phage tail sheath subtilisin-like domain-containing protein [Burkholderiales bacterium]|nr:phage tail sheath subtilisin-like domain-containing protein [Burkholderiales bacterium]
MSTYKTPDVYIKEVPFFASSVAQVETAVPAFIGLVEKAYDNDGKETTPSASNVCVRRITSLLEYIQYFGQAKNITATVTKDAISANLSFVATTGHLYAMYYAINNYFANGGGAAYIIAVGTYADTDVKTKKEQIDKGLAAIEKIDEVTLLLCPDAAQFEDKTIYYDSFAVPALRQAEKLQDRFVLIDVIHDKEVAASAVNLREKVPAHSSLKYGAAYYPKLKTTLAYPYADKEIKLEGFAYGTAPDKVVTLDALKLVNDAEYAQVKAFLTQKTVSLPPSAAIAGVYAQTDAARGVWKAPANVALAQVIGPEVLITNDDQGSLNVDPVAGKSINAIRAFTGKGTLVWGARTLMGNDNEWRYINVRRLFNTVEESIKKATYFAVFEPNTPMTWLKVKSMIESYLRGMWLDGALFGESTEQAFYVNIGLNQTMTEDDINNGLMKVKIGLAAVRPAEFIELSFSHKTIS